MVCGAAEFREPLPTTIIPKECNPVALIDLHNINLSFGGPLLLDRANLRLEPGRRVGLVGRNGAGKSSLIKLIAGRIKPDSGEMARQPGLRVGYMPQDSPAAIEGSIQEVVSSGLPPAGDQPGQEDWRGQTMVDTVVSRLKLDPKAGYNTLSGGLKRKTLLARALVSQPDLLLLDEPTNQLDIESITWLEEFLFKQAAALVFVSHDRMFTAKLAQAVVELDRGRLIDWGVGYDLFLERREAALANEEARWAEQDRKTAQEEDWLHGGLKARRTRNMGRVRRLEEMRRERAERRLRTGSAVMEASTAGRSGAIVAEVDKVAFGYDAEPIIKDFSTIIMRGDRIGLLGPNGAGKTTLLGLLLGRLTPDEGRVRQGTNLEIVYFDQFREQLDEEASVRENVGQGNDYVEINGRQRHIIGYLKDFLFTPEQAAGPVKALSGGERNRLLLARLFTRPSNLLVLDEPTNDLDSDALELLEAVLLDYSGTILLVSHDRAFVNNVVTSTLVFEGAGLVREYAGGYDDWLLQRPRPAEEEAGKKAPKPKPAKDRPRKRTFKERRELEELPGLIDALEAEQAELEQTMADPDFFRTAGAEAARAATRLEEIEAQLEQALIRWEELEAIPE